MGVVGLYRRFAVRIFWVTMAIVYALAIMPSQQAPDLGAGDKVNHIAAFLTLTLLGRAAYPARRPWKLAAGLSLFGALIEFTQAIPFIHRDASLWDWIADSVAVLAALCAALAIERRLMIRSAV